MSLSDYNIEKYAQILGMPKSEFENLVTNSGGGSVSNNFELTGSFFSNDSTPANIQKLADRVFVGKAVEQDGTSVPAQRTWVGQL